VGLLAHVLGNEPWRFATTHVFGLSSRVLPGHRRGLSSSGTLAGTEKTPLDLSIAKAQIGPESSRLSTLSIRCLPSSCRRNAASDVGRQTSDGGPRTSDLSRRNTASDVGPQTSAGPNLNLRFESEVRGLKSEVRSPRSALRPPLANLLLSTYYEEVR